MNIIESKSKMDLYLVFEIMDSDLQKVIVNIDMTELQAKYIIYQIVSAVNCMHKLGLVHRDIKPSNVLINDDCKIRIADFGMVRSVVH